LFQWAEFIDLAKTLGDEAKRDGSEGKRRSAISRAYYATFHAARDYAVKSFGFDIAERDVHSRLWKALKTQPGKEAPILGQRGEELMRLRRRADYDRTPPVADSLVQQGLTMASLASGLLKSIEAGDAASATQ